jgi:Putative Actinobacterial Holin-X, holin superfamily III
MAEPVFKLQLLARSELALTQIYARRATTRSSYYAVALVLFLLGVSMLNFAAYLALAESYSPATAALIVAAVNALGGVIVLLLGRKAGPSENEEQLARDIREMAYREVSQDVNDIKGRLENLVQEVNTIGENVTRATSAVRYILGLLKK